MDAERVERFDPDDLEHMLAALRRARRHNNRAMELEIARLLIGRDDAAFSQNGSRLPLVHNKRRCILDLLDTLRPIYLDSPGVARLCWGDSNARLFACEVADLSIGIAADRYSPRHFRHLNGSIAVARRFALGLASDDELRSAHADAMLAAWVERTDPACTAGRSAAAVSLRSSASAARDSMRLTALSVSVNTGCGASEYIRSTVRPVLLRYLAGITTTATDIATR